MNNKNYVLHTAPKSISEKIKSEGFLYKKGRPTVTGNIPFELDHAMNQLYKEKPEAKGELCTILCMELPKEKKLKTSIKGNITIDYEKKEIHGKPNIRMRGKSQGGIFEGGKHHKGKKNITSYLEFDDMLHKENINLELQQTPELIAIASKLSTQISDFKKINIGELKQELLAAIQTSIVYQKQGIDLEEIVDKILMSTLQSSCMEFIRILYLASADNDGYKLYNEKKVERDMRKRKSEYYKLIDRFSEYLKIANKSDFDLFNDVIYDNLNRYLKSSINYISKKFGFGMNSI